MHSLWGDVRYGCRSLLRRPGFTSLTVLTLALGIGVNTVAFSAINALLLRPFGMPDAGRIGWILLPGPGNVRGAASLSDLDVVVRSTRSFESVVAEGRLPVGLRTPAGGEQAWALAITANYLQTLGARPLKGRLFVEADLREPELPAVVSHRFWTETLGRPDSLAGRTITVNGRTFAVVGVMPDDFQGIGGLFAPDMWLPLARLDALNLPARATDGAWLALFGRLAPGVQVPQAQAELNAVAEQLEPAGRGDARRTARFYPMSGGHPELRDIGRGAWLAFGAVGVVFLIACFNVTALLMARSAERQKEIGIRCAVGASRGRILRQLAVEGVLLAAIGGAVALIVASWSADLLATFSLPAPIPQRVHLGIERRLVLFTVALIAAAGVVPTILPAWQATQPNLLRSIRMESLVGGRPSRARNAFVVAQIAGATLFVVAALLFVRSFTNQVSVPARFDTANTVALELWPGMYGYDIARSRALIDALQARLASLSGVTDVSVADRVPFYVGMPKTVPYGTEGPCARRDCRRATTYSVGRGYFGALGVPIRAGRDFTDAELRTASAVVVSERMAAEAWPGEEAVGRSLRIGDEGRLVEVIGVAADYVHRNVSEPPTGYVYLPLRDDQYGQALTVVVRTAEDPALLVRDVHAQLRALAPQLPAAAIATLAERMRMPHWIPRTVAGFFVICGTLALVLATVGLFGVMYFTVAQRTREFGIRAALGASRGRVIRLVVGEGLRLAVPGALLGMTGGHLVGRLLSGALYGVAPTDPATFAATAAIQVVVAVAACVLPACRAMRADPMRALRQE